jgi:hypothetical protein
VPGVISSTITSSELQSYRENIFLNENNQKAMEEETEEGRGIKRRHVE